MRKDEMETAWSNYLSLSSRATGCLDCGNWKEGLRHASDSLPFVDGMIQYERKYKGADKILISSISNICRFAPALFQSTLLDQVKSTITSNRRISTYSKTDVQGQLQTAYKQSEPA